MRIRDDNTNRYYEYSYNGVDWVALYSATRTDFLIPDQIGWGGDSYSQAVSARLSSWNVA
jgi:hypothetical protein